MSGSRNINRACGDINSESKITEAEMSISNYLNIFCASLAITTMTLAQTQPITPSTMPAATQPMEERILPEVRFDSMGLDDVLDFLHDVEPRFTPIIVRSGGVPKGYPQISMKANNITVPQFLSFLSKAYGIETEAVRGPVAPLWLVSVKMNNQIIENINANRKAEPNPFQGPGPTEAPTSLSFARLTEIIDAIAMTKKGELDERNKAAIGDVMSLVQAAMDQTHNPKQAILKMHEPTQTLMLKGTAEQVKVLKDLIEALTPKGTQSNAYMSEIRRLESTTAMLRSELDQLRQSAGNAPATRPKE